MVSVSSSSTPEVPIYEVDYTDAAACVVMCESLGLSDVTVSEALSVARYLRLVLHPEAMVREIRRYPLTFMRLIRSQTGDLTAPWHSFKSFRRTMCLTQRAMSSVRFSPERPERTWRYQRDFDYLSNFASGLRRETLARWMRQVREFGRERPGVEDADDLRHEFAYLPSRLTRRVLEALQQRCGIEAVQDMANELMVCQDCGSVVNNDDTAHTYDDQIVCSSCLESDYRWSEYHGGYFPRSEANEYYPTVRSYERGDPDYIHADETRNYCEHDGAYFPDHVYDTLFGDDEDEDEDERDSGATPSIGHYHSSKGMLAVHRSTPDGKPVAGPVVGVELEVEVYGGYSRDGCAELALRRLNAHHWIGHPLSRPAISTERYAWAECDGSLDRGFEIVTAAGPLEMHRAHMGAFLSDAEAIEGLSSHDTDTCGLHVHVDKSGLSALTIGKVLVFVNSPDNAHLVLSVARRDLTHTYSKVKHKKLTDGRRGSPERYEAVNVTRETLEFRIFRGSLKFEAVMAAIEFARSVVLFCKTASARSLDSKSFLAWCERQENRGETRYLREYLKERGYSVHAKSTAPVERPAPQPDKTPEVKDDTPTQFELAA
jgi:hypothetical protein